MRKISVLLTAAILLAACTDKKSVNTAEEVNNLEPLGQQKMETDIFKQPGQTEDLQTDNTARAEGGGEEAYDGLAQQPSDLPEYETIQKETDDQTYSYKIVNDNKNKRVMLLIDEDGTEVYKTIFIKTDSRLKIIKKEGGRQLFNKAI